MLNIQFVFQLVHEYFQVEIPHTNSCQQYIPLHNQGPHNLFYLFELQHKLEEIIGVSKVDLIQKGAIHPALKEKILTEAVNVA